MSVIDCDATAILGLLRTKSISATELLAEIASRVTRDDGAINSIVVKDFDRAKRAAVAADLARAKGGQQRLLGLPLTIKESFDVAGLPTTWGLQGASHDPVGQNAAVVDRVAGAGAVVIGKTNVPEFLDGLGSTNPVYGRTSNPLNRDWSPGGSSSGSAAAVRSGFSYLDIGSDLSGSIRHPAAFCGVFGHAPSLGLVPARGHSVFGQLAPLDMSTPGPIARSARDLKLAMEILAGPDSDLANGFRVDMTPARHKDVAGFRILVLPRHPLVPTDPDICDAVEEFSAALASQGAHVADATALIPDVADSTHLYIRQLGAALSVGQDCDSRDEKKAERAALGSNDTSIRASFLRGSLATHAEWLADYEARIRLRWRWREVFREFDAVICPAAPVRRITHEETGAPNVSVAGVDTPQFDLIVWAALSKSADLPATVLPYRAGAKGPIGIQVIGPFMEDLTPITLAAAAGARGISPSYAQVVALTSS